MWDAFPHYTEITRQNLSQAFSELNSVGSNPLLMFYPLFPSTHASTLAPRTLQWTGQQHSVALTDPFRGSLWKTNALSLFLAWLWSRPAQCQSPKPSSSIFQNPPSCSQLSQTCWKLKERGLRIVPLFIYEALWVRLNPGSAMYQVPSQFMRNTVGHFSSRCEDWTVSIGKWYTAWDALCWDHTLLKQDSLLIS